MCESEHVFFSPTNLDSVTDSMNEFVKGHDYVMIERDHKSLQKSQRSDFNVSVCLSVSICPQQLRRRDRESHLLTIGSSSM